MRVGDVGQALAAAVVLTAGAAAAGTDAQSLREAAVQGDWKVVDVLLRNMQDDPVPLFRDKAACALAYDQIHLAPRHKVHLFEGLVSALADAKPQVRAIALQALHILTGQTKGFRPAGRPEARAAALEEWVRWVAEYRAHQ